MSFEPLVTASYGVLTHLPEFVNRMPLAWRAVTVTAMNYSRYVPFAGDTAVLHTDPFDR